MSERLEDAERQEGESVYKGKGEIQGNEEGGEEPETKRLKTAEEEQREEAPPPSYPAQNASPAFAAMDDVNPDDEEDEAKAGGDAVPTTPPEDQRRRSSDRSHVTAAEDVPPAPKPPAPADWRETLFVWRGVVTYDPTKRRCNWLGSWAPQVSHSDGPPTSRDFETHQENTFVLHRVIDKRIDLGGARTIPDVLYGRSLSWLGFYKLDQDDGKGRQRLVDYSHLFMVQPAEQTRRSDDDGIGNVNEKLLGIVSAVGSNEFGDFVSAGRMVELTTPSPEPDESNEQGHMHNERETKIELTMARRYITNKDKRCKWKMPKEAMKELDLEILKNSEDFWAVLPTKVE